VFVSSDGFVLEAPTASLILRLDGRFVTPAPNGGILHGTTQLSLFAHLEQQGLETDYATIPIGALSQADAAWLVSSVRLAAPITAIDGAAVPVDPDLTASFNRYLLSPRD
jgi:4-amino-4-deoxychorismate lyase